MKCAKSQRCWEKKKIKELNHDGRFASTNNANIVDMKVVGWTKKGLGGRSKSESRCRYLLFVKGWSGVDYRYPILAYARDDAYVFV